MKRSKGFNIIVILILTVFVIVTVCFVIRQAMKNIDDKETAKQSIETDGEIVVGEEIIKPDRIVYKDSNSNYYEFKKDSEKYNEIIDILSNSIRDYNENGQVLTDEKIDDIHENTSFIEFDYETVSKNYIIQLNNNNSQAVIKLANTGGQVCTETISNVDEIKEKLNYLIDGEKAYKFEYVELISNNKLNLLEYKYTSLFNMVDYNIYQVKIDNMEDYEKFKTICNFSISDTITDEKFEDSEIILTLSKVPEIAVKVNIGNIRYTYEAVDNSDGQYKVHLLIVSKIVNTDCIYNTDMAQIDSEVASDNEITNYNETVSNLDDDIFVTDFEQFLTEYTNSTATITAQEAEEIAEKGFEEAKRICGSYDKETEEVTETTASPNNFFTRLMTEVDTTYSGNIEVYMFSRSDDIGNGVKVFVDKKLGKIIGGAAFGD